MRILIEEAYSVVAAAVILSIIVTCVLVMSSSLKSTSKVVTYSQVYATCYAVYTNSTLHVVVSNLGLRDVVTKLLVVEHGKYRLNQTVPVGKATDIELKVWKDVTGSITVVYCDYERDICRQATCPIIKIELNRTIESKNISSVEYALWTPDVAPAPGYTILDVVILPPQVNAKLKVTIRENVTGRVETYYVESGLSHRRLEVLSRSYICIEVESSNMKFLYYLSNVFGSKNSSKVCFIANRSSIYFIAVFGFETRLIPVVVDVQCTNCRVESPPVVTVAYSVDNVEVMRQLHVGDHIELKVPIGAKLKVNVTQSFIVEKVLYAGCGALIRYHKYVLDKAEIRIGSKIEQITRREVELKVDKPIVIKVKYRYDKSWLEERPCIRRETVVKLPPDPICTKYCRVVYENRCRLVRITIREEISEQYTGKTISSETIDTGWTVECETVIVDVTCWKVCKNERKR